MAPGGTHTGTPGGPGRNFIKRKMLMVRVAGKLHCIWIPTPESNEKTKKKKLKLKELIQYYMMKYGQGFPRQKWQVVCTQTLFCTRRIESVLSVSVFIFVWFQGWGIQMQLKAWTHDAPFLARNSWRSRIEFYFCDVARNKLHCVTPPPPSPLVWHPRLLRFRFAKTDKT